MDILRFTKANCKNCFKCLRECPVKAIAFRDGQAEILREDCLICGHCLTVCPQNAKEVRNDIPKVAALIASGARVYASVAPSFAASFHTNFEAFAAALRKLGFTDASETSVAAAAVAEEYHRLLREKTQEGLISSSCPTIIKLIEKYHPECLSYLAPVLSPMTAHARMLKAAFGSDIRVVFIGPCISKKDEAGWDADAVDCAITFEELGGWFSENGIAFGCNEPAADPSDKAARLFPLEGGILKSLPERLPGVRYLTISGMKRCREMLREIARDGLAGCFVEMSACEGSCIGGPCGTEEALGLLRATERVVRTAEEPHAPKISLPTVPLGRQFRPGPVLGDMPGEQQIREILAKTGKVTPDRELNCGACGYPTCREKAIAVWQGKAELTMCLPYMRDRAEYISDKVLSFTPNAIIVLDNFLGIQAMNAAALRMFGISDVKFYSGRYIGDLTDATVFEEALVRRENILDRRIYLYQNSIYVEESVIYVKEHNFIFGIIRDTTESEKQNEKLRKVKLDTIRTADNVIEKQMRVVQEIAMLLGETTAETKIALTKLKETMLAEEE